MCETGYWGPGLCFHDTFNHFLSTGRMLRSLRVKERERQRQRDTERERTRKSNHMEREKKKKNPKNNQVPVAK